MKGLNKITGGIMICLLAGSLSSCRVDEVEVSGFRGIRLHRFSNRQLGVEVLMQVKNPNRLSFRITGIDLDVTLNDRYLGKITNAEKIRIPGVSDQEHSLHLNIEMDSWISGLTTFINMLGKRTAVLEIDGYIRVKSSILGKTIRISEITEVEVIP
ncbi:MAG TPA: hypothetical protein ENN63_02480 [Bacteroidetes bacterium]|nr:hypothetical protein [Bacteroidota bacterium]